MSEQFDYQTISSVLFVCMGNICRSPTAEAVLQHKADEGGYFLTIESAGTGNWHAGSPPEPRAIKAGQDRGYDLTSIRARQVEEADFVRFDLILAMDRDNLDELHKMADPAHHPKIQLFLQQAQTLDEEEVPDPYYGGLQGFVYVLDLIEHASDALLEKLEKLR